MKIDFQFVDIPKEMFDGSCLSKGILFDGVLIKVKNIRLGATDKDGNKMYDGDWLDENMVPVEPERDNIENIFVEIEYEVLKNENNVDEEKIKDAMSVIIQSILNQTVDAIDNGDIDMEDVEEDAKGKDE